MALGIARGHARKYRQLAALNSHQRLLRRRGEQGAILRPQRAAAIASTTARPRRVTVVQHPLIHFSAVMKPDGVIKTRRHKMFHRVLMRVRVKDSTEQGDTSQVQGIRKEPIKVADFSFTIMRK